MYVVIEYLNYRKDMMLDILHIVPTFKRADELARQYAEKQFGLDYVDSVDESWLLLRQAKSQYTEGNGYFSTVYAVLKVPQSETDNWFWISSNTSKPVLTRSQSGD